MVKRGTLAYASPAKRLCQDARSEQDSEAPCSISTVSLSDAELQLGEDDATSQHNRPVPITFTDLEAATSSSGSSKASQGSTTEEDCEEETRRETDMSEEAFQQNLSVMRCRYRAELEKIEDEVGSSMTQYDPIPVLAASDCKC